MARQGLPAKYAKMGFKRGWAAFKAAKRGGGKARTVKASPRKRAAVSAKRPPAKTRARKRPRTNARGLIAAPVKIVRRVVQPGSVMRAARIAVAAATGVGGAAASRAVVNMIPGTTLIRGLVQAGIGIAGIIGAPKSGIAQYLRYAGVGATLGGAALVTKSLLPGLAPYLAGTRTRVPYYGSPRPASTVAPMQGNANFARRELMGSCGMSLGAGRMRGYGPNILNAYQ